MDAMRKAISFFILEIRCIPSFLICADLHGTLNIQLELETLLLPYIRCSDHIHAFCLFQYVHNQNNLQYLDAEWFCDGHAFE